MQHMKISVADTGLQVRVRPGNPDSEMGGAGGGGGRRSQKLFFLKMRGGGAGCATTFGQGQIRPSRPGPSCLKGRLTTLSTG